MVREGHGFVLTLQKGKSYAFGESNLGVVSNLPGLKFNPAEILSVYLDKIALVHSKSDSFFFPLFALWVGC